MTKQAKKPIPIVASGTMPGFAYRAGMAAARDSMQRVVPETKFMQNYSQAWLDGYDGLEKTTSDYTAPRG